MEEDFINRVEMVPGGYLVVGALDAAELAQRIRRCHGSAGSVTADCLEKIAEDFLALYQQENGEI